MYELENRQIEVKVTPDPGITLFFDRMVGSEELGRPFRYEVDVVSTSAARSALLGMLGAKMTVKVQLPEQGRYRYFNGIIARASYLGQRGQYESYRFELRPQLWLLTHQVNSRIFQRKRLIEVVQAVLREAGITDLESKVMNASSLPQQEYCVQYRESTFDFLSRLMEEIGVYYYHLHGDGTHKLVLADDPSCHAPLPGAATIQYYESDSSYRRELDHVWDWRTTASFSPAAYEQRDFNFETPALDLTTRHRMKPAHQFSTFEVFDYPGAYGKPGDGSTLAAIRMQELAAMREVASGEGNVRAIFAGGKFTLKDFGDGTQNREYLVIGTACELTMQETDGGGGSEDTFRVAFQVVPATVHFRPRRLTPRPVIQGPQTAMVVGPAGQEIHTDKYGRVKVRFHWDREATQDQDASCWIRVSQPWAGVGWGGIAIPRIKQEVIVEFLEGDPDRPIITGRVYNETAKVPYELPANQTRTTIKSRSTPNATGFNELRFEDKAGSEEFFLHAQKDMSIVVLNDQTTTIRQNRSVTIEEANDTLKVAKGNRTIDVVQGNDTTTVGQGNQSVTVSQGSQTITVSQGNQTTEVSAGKSSLTAGQEILLKVGGNSVKIDTTSITLTVGSNSVKLDASGVTVNGAMITLSAQGKLEATASGTTIVKGATVMIN